MNKVPVAPIAMATVIPLEPDYSSEYDSVTPAAGGINGHDAPFTEYQIQELMKQGFTKGLSMSLEEMKKIFALRIWIVDNSGSMSKPDGHRIVASPTDPNEIKMIPCSRWDEIGECIEYHAKLSGLIDAPTRFRMLNDPGMHVGPQNFSVAENDWSKSIAQQVQEATSIMRTARPGGCTPLVRHILEIHDEVSQMVPELRRLGQKVAIIIATDGLPSDDHGYSGPTQKREFVDALRMLEVLPVWVVVRLCTDDDCVVDFYNDLDCQLELSLEVLDDFCGEAAEVTKTNPWLNYGLPLHRMREFGFNDPVFDMLDERPLLKSDIRDFSLLLFGKENLDGMADPSIEWGSFFQDIVRLLKMESYQYNPMTKRASPWINASRLNKIHGSSGCGCSIM